MHISIRKVFMNLKIGLLVLGIGVTLLCAQLFHVSQYSERLGALKNQHLLIDKIINTNLNDPKMASILINGALSEIELSVKLSGQEALLDSFVTSNEEQASLLRSLKISSEAFRDNVLIWSESLTISQNSTHTLMMNARSAYLADIDRMMDYQIHIISESIATAKMTAILVFFAGLFIFLFYRQRLNTIYRDLHKACSIDTDGIPKVVSTQEVDFILKRLLRKSSQHSQNPSLIHNLSGLNNVKGLISSFNAKKAGKGGNNVFLALFEIDNYTSLVKTLSDEDMENLFKKIAGILSMYEQPQDVTAHIDEDRFIFLMSRSSKQLAIQEAEQIVASVGESSFNTAQASINITLSGGFLLKPPAKSLDEAIKEAIELIEKAKETGGNRVAQRRERFASTR
ncbi:diguanylate cyclase domain-containing protein [Sulfuricurvum sp.]|uniref:diguanylate cyclase domain-containing protein n=1 Tax=Sulfuricurvum sp. TaxID=2025608 RepID=UPI003BB073E0